ncbi:Ig-like domain-containing protein [Geobacillus sp. TFV-3]|uniref:Ig-like domain-containing protein n=1 Tax=Geobacillus sp. TFV-3 TaxID=1897059 RepID=UPI001359C363|nr:Ig-like domain-containing protein [Geobacillus sp. TFV-3]KAF0996522.1 Outer cell wall protein [Geobacillus sp. TFV-3]
MDKKKAVKLATASAVAASAFVAANPHASQAATDVATVVSQAKAQMKEAYYTYSHTVTETGKLPNISDVYAAYNQAKQAYANAVAVVNKAGGAKKDAYLADLQATYETYVFKANPKSGEARVATYIDAYNYATKLDAMRQELKAAIDAKDLKKAEDLYHTISYELKTRTVILDRVYGQSTRDLLRSQFKAEAQKLRDSLVYDITVSMKAREAQDAIKAGNLDKAKAALDQVNQYVSKVTDAFKAELQKAAQDANAAYEAALTPKVESVSAINAKQIEIKFNKAVDKSTIFSNVTTGTLNAGVVTVKRTVNDTTDANKNVDSSSDTITGSLSADGKTLTLTVDATSAKYFDGTYAVTVSDAVKATDGKALTAYAGTFTTKDQTSPTVSNVSYNTITNKIEVTFSEPITAVPDVVRLNGEPVTSASFVVGTNRTKIDFAKPSSVAAGSTATLYVAGAKDAANNILTPYTGNVTITNDASALQVTSVTQISSNQLKVVFNKSLASDSATIDGALTAVIDGTVVSSNNVTAALDTTDTSNKTVIVTFSGTAPNYFYGSANSKAVTLVFADNAIADVFGKKLAATTQSVTMTKDVTGPKVVSAKVASNGKDIEVTFDEAISGAAGDIDTSKIVLRKDGVALSAVANATQKAATGDGAKVLVITPATADLVSGKLPAGTYTVRLDAGAVKDAHTNTNAAATATVSISATTTDLTATIANQTVSSSAVPNVFEVTFSEDVTAASALNPANYTLDGAALPSGTDIYFKNGAANRTVVIELPSNSINIGSATTPANAVLAVKNVQTSTGKTVVATSGTVKVKDNTPATLQSATLVGNNILKLTFNENISASFANIADILDDIEISNGTTTFTAGDATATASVSGKDLIITVTPGNSNWSTVTSSPTVTVKTLGTGDGDIKDVNGVTVKGDVSVTLAK